MNVMAAKRCAITAVAMLAGAAAVPAYADSFSQWAPVIRVTPIYTRVHEPRQQCRLERVATDEGDGYSDLRDVERCRTVDIGSDVIDGYEVTYRYQNRDFTMRMPYDPGSRVQVNVDVQPAPQ